MTDNIDNLLLRPASINDAKILYLWRNDSMTRLSSHNTNKIKWNDHINWLKSMLDNKDKKIFIAESNGKPVGTIRAEYIDNVYKLSWTVSPESRGKDFGKKMVKLLTCKINAPIRAEIKKENVASAKIAEYSGMKLLREDNNILYYQRDAINQS